MLPQDPEQALQVNDLLLKIRKEMDFMWETLQKLITMVYFSVTVIFGLFLAYAFWWLVTHVKIRVQ
jgi:hypothetical protein